jgi:hypothetical protein
MTVTDALRAPAPTVMTPVRSPSSRSDHPARAPETSRMVCWPNVAFGGAGDDEAVVGMWLGRAFEVVQSQM